MRVTPRSEAEAQKAKAKPRTLLPAGWHAARIANAHETLSKRGNEMIEVTLIVIDAGGNERTLMDWLTLADSVALKFRHAAVAVGALAQYEAGEIGQADFAGRDVEIEIIVQKRRGWPDSNKVVDYRRVATATGVVTLRQAG